MTRALSVARERLEACAYAYVEACEHAPDEQTGMVLVRARLMLAAKAFVQASREERVRRGA